MRRGTDYPTQRRCNKAVWRRIKEKGIYMYCNRVSEKYIHIHVEYMYLTMYMYTLVNYIKSSAGIHVHVLLSHDTYMYT